MQNITTLRRTEQSLRESERRLRDLVESATDAIFTLNFSPRATRPPRSFRSRSG